jgi:hypothetical protein
MVERQRGEFKRQAEVLKNIITRQIELTGQDPLASKQIAAIQLEDKTAPSGAAGRRRSGLMHTGKRPCHSVNMHCASDPHQ